MGALDYEQTEVSPKPPIKLSGDAMGRFALGAFAAQVLTLGLVWSIGILKFDPCEVAGGLIGFTVTGGLLRVVLAIREKYFTGQLTERYSWMTLFSGAAVTAIGILLGWLVYQFRLGVWMAIAIFIITVAGCAWTTFRPITDAER